MTPAAKPAKEKDDRSPSIAHIDDAVANVFETMLRQPCVLTTHPSDNGPGISAKIVFSGPLEGHCILQISAIAADRVADILLGAEGDWDDQLIEDAVGELCNMIAGGWKSRLSDAAAASQLSIPAITRSAAGHTSATTRRFYKFNNETLEVALTLA